MENAAERVSKVDRLIKKEQSQADKKKVKWPEKKKCTIKLMRDQGKDCLVRPRSTMGKGREGQGIQFTVLCTQLRP